MTQDCARNIAHLFESDRIAGNFSTVDRLFPTSEIASPEPSPALPKGQIQRLPNAVLQWIETQWVTSFLVLKDGALIHESAHRGTQPEDRRMSWSIAKSFLSVLFGILRGEGMFPSLDVSATEYAPALKGSAYDGVTLEHLLQMTSGVAFDEDYHDPASDIRRLADYLGRGGGLDAYMAARQKRHAAPGAVWVYNSLDTQALGMVIRGATGRDTPDLLSEKLITPLGCEAAPGYLTDARGVAFVLGGLTMRARDYARFGQMMADRGRWQGRQIVPRDWTDRVDHGLAPTPEGELGYGDQWWRPADAVPGEFMACGIYGQYIYVNRAARTVCVTTSANRRFSEEGVFENALDIFRQIAAL
ncbi:serine hydrolase domain-containing protein [Roseovarius sp. 2305UL8-3]|uniref:serine hydrolase domain-containing protein n=1 Tax=Roseovarius conchicola TaxID=3121636 RepID=UPI003526D8B8